MHDGTYKALLVCFSADHKTNVYFTTELDNFITAG